MGDRNVLIALGYLPLQLVAFLADDAPGDGDRPLVRLPLLELVEPGVDAVLRCLAHDAGVQDRDVGALERLLDIAGREQSPCQVLRVGQVHLAADGPDVERARLFPRPRYRLSTSNLMPVRSSPSIEMSMKAGMH